MDVDCFNFKALLPSIVSSISRSRFVALDLELSGIPTKLNKKPRDPATDNSGKQSLQQRYEETKSAAGKFHVLQLGLTCVEEDTERGKRLAATWSTALTRLRRLRDEALQLQSESNHRTSS